MEIFESFLLVFDPKNSITSTSDAGVIPHDPCGAQSSSDGYWHSAAVKPREFAIVGLPRVCSLSASVKLWASA